MHSNKWITKNNILSEGECIKINVLLLGDTWKILILRVSPKIIQIMVKHVHYSNRRVSRFRLASLLEILPLRSIFKMHSTFFSRISWPLRWEEGNFNKRFLANLCGGVESPSSRNGRRWKFYDPRGISSTLKSGILILIPDVHRRRWPDDDEQSHISHPHRTSGIQSIFNSIDEWNVPSEDW